MEMECPNCSATIPLGKKFCGQCGQKIDSEPPSPTIDYQRPESYTPKFMAEKILTTRSSVQGERKIVTVLFGDVAGYTSLSEKLDPEDVHQIMDGCFKILMDEIHRYEGTINQFTGDGVMALFGAPLAHEDHAQRACHAALSIQKAMEEYNRQVVNVHHVDFKMRIGLNSGPVVVGAIGDDLRMDYTAIGDTTNMAARMESMATPGSVLLSSKTSRLAMDYFELTSLGEVQIKGKAEPQEIFELTGVGKVITRLDASIAKGLTRFLGRKREMDVLREAFDNTRSGTGQVIGIVGEAGVGKSRLNLELRAGLGEACHYLEGRCLQFGSTIPFLPVLDILRGFFEITDDDRDANISDRMKEKLRQLDENLLRALPAYQDLLSLAVDDPSWNALDPKEKRNMTFEAIRDLLIRYSEDRPLILLVDDLHWMDKTSEEFLGYFIDWLSHASILLLLCYRPEYSHGWGSKSYYSKIGLDQLPLDTCGEFIQSVLGKGSVNPELKDLLLSRAAGNPLFMEELTRTLLQNGSIVEKDGHYSLGAEISHVDVPDTIQGIIAARMDRLEDSIKRTMQMASVVGRDFAYPILHAITDMQEELKTSLLTLQGLEFIYEKRLFPELEYIFKHAVTQEVAYNSLLRRKRREIHEKIGKALERIYQEKLDEFVEIIAHHYAQSANHEKSTHYLILAGDRAMRNNSGWEAFGFYKQALNALHKLPTTGENNQLQLEVLHKMIVPVILLGFPEEALEILKQGRQLSEDLGDQKSLIRFLSNMGLFYATRGGHEQGMAYSGRAFEEAEKTRDVRLMAQTSPDFCLSLMTAGRFASVIDIATRIVKRIDETGTQSEKFGGPANIYNSLLCITGYCKAIMGQLTEGFALCKESLERSSGLGDLTTTGLCEFYCGIILLMKGDAEPAMGYLERSVKLLEKARFIQPLALSWSSLGFAHTLRGDPSKGLECSQKGLNFYSEAGVTWHMASHLFILAWCRAVSGDAEGARTTMEEALASARENHEKYAEGKALLWMGKILAGPPFQDHGGAEDAIMRGIEILESLKARVDLSTAQLFLGELYADRGRTEKAREHVKAAAAMFRDMEMDEWLDRAEKKLQDIGANG